MNLIGETGLMIIGVMFKFCSVRRDVIIVIDSCGMNLKGEMCLIVSLVIRVLSILWLEWVFKEREKF